MWQCSVVRIVREKMLRTEAFSDPEQLQAFLSQLYVFLVDEMHAALNKVMTQNIHFCYLLGEASGACLEGVARGVPNSADWSEYNICGAGTVRVHLKSHGLPLMSYTNRLCC